MATQRIIPLGLIVSTPGATQAMKQAGDSVLKFLSRHSRGDWGCLDDKDKAVTKAGGRIVSAYRLKNGTKIWVVTEADRSSTTVLLPEEY